MSIQFGIPDDTDSMYVRYFNNERIKLYSDVQSNLLEIVSGCNETALSLGNIYIASSNYGSNLVISTVQNNTTDRLFNISRDAAIFGSSSCLFTSNIRIMGNINIVGTINNNNQPIQITGIIGSNVMIYATSNDYTPFNIFGNGSDIVSLNTSTDRFFIQPNVGVGTTIPRYKLHTIGSMYSSDGIYTGYIRSNINGTDINIYGGLNVNGILNIKGNFSLAGANLSINSPAIINNEENDRYSSIYLNQPAGDNPFTTFSIEDGGTSNTVFALSSSGRTYIGHDITDKTIINEYEAFSASNSMVTVSLPAAFSNNNLINSTSYNMLNGYTVSDDGYIGIGTTIVKHPVAFYFNPATNLASNILSNAASLHVQHTDMPDKHFLYASSNSDTAFFVDKTGSVSIGSNTSIYLSSNGDTIIGNILYVSNVSIYNNLVSANIDTNLVGMGIIQSRSLFGSNLLTNTLSVSNISVSNVYTDSLSSTHIASSCNTIILNNLYIGGILDGENTNIFLGYSDYTYFLPATSGPQSLAYFRTSNVLISPNSNYTELLSSAIDGNSNGVLQIQTYPINNSPITPGISVYGHNHSSIKVSATNPYIQLQRPSSNVYNIGINPDGEMYFGRSNGTSPTYTDPLVNIMGTSLLSLGSEKTRVYVATSGSVLVSTVGNNPSLLSTGGFETRGQSCFRTSNGLSIMYMDNSTGYIGIGTTVARKKLDIDKDAIVSGNIGIGILPQYTKLDVQGTALLFNNVGIGTTITRSFLDINGDIITKNNIGIGTTVLRSLFDIEGDVVVAGNIGIGTTFTNQTGLYIIGNSSIIGTLATTSNIYVGNGLYGRLYGVANSSIMSSNALGLVGTPDITVGTVTSGSITTNNSNINAGVAVVNASVYIGDLAGIANSSIYSSNASYSSNATYSSNLLGKPDISVSSITTNNNSVNTGSGTVTSSSNYYGDLAGIANSCTIASNAYGALGNDIVLDNMNTGDLTVDGTLIAYNPYIMGLTSTLKGYTTFFSNVDITNSSGADTALSVYNKDSRYSISEFYDVDTGTIALCIAAGGNIGIGTATPATSLHVNGNAYISGNIGIGTTEPPSGLAVWGDAIVSNSIGIGTTLPRFYLDVLGSCYFANNVGIGGTTIPNNQLHVTNSMLLGTSTLRSTSNYVVPSSIGRVNNVSITALNRRTRTTYASSVRCASTWYSRTSASDSSWLSVCWSPELTLFCAVSSSGTGNNNVMTSPDGVNWITRSTNNNQWQSVCWSPELSIFCAVASIGNGRVMTSSDGIVWTTRLSGDEGSSWQSVCWSSVLSLFCAIASSGTTQIMTSSNGITWTTRTSAASVSWQSICWSPDLSTFCAVASSGVGNRVMTSTTGIDGWVTRSTSGFDNNWQYVCWSPELCLFCAVASGGSVTGKYVMTSSDGTNWVSRTSPANNSWYSVCWAPEISIFCAVANNANAGTSNIMISQNGIDWITKTAPTITSWNSICWSPELSIFCSVSSSGTGNRVMNSEKAMPNSLTTIDVFPGQVTTNALGKLGIGTTMVCQDLDIASNVYVYQNVGIGTTLPINRLHVQGISYHSTSIGIGTTIPRNALDINGNMIVNRNIGIGTTLPRAPLHVEGIALLSNVTNIGSIVVSSPPIISIQPTIGTLPSGVSSNNTVAINNTTYYVSGSGGGLSYHAMVLDNNGILYGWGRNNYGQLGINSTSTKYVPTMVSNYGSIVGKTIRSIALGDNHSIVIDSTGALHAWGRNNSGQLGNNLSTGTSGTDYRSLIPVSISSYGSIVGKSITSIACGSEFTLAVDSTGSVHGWGYNYNGELGNNHSTGSSTNGYRSIVPVSISSYGSISGKTIVSVVCGEDHSLALDSTGGVHAWGYNNYGQLGNNRSTGTSGTGYRSLIPVSISSYGSISGKTIVALSCGYRFSLALDSTGGVHAWGYNYTGQLGINSTSSRYIPQSVSGYGSLVGKQIVSISCGYYHSLALDSTGYLHAWGNNGYGQLGNNSFISTIIPVIIAYSGSFNGMFNGNMKKILSVVTGRYFSYAIDVLGSLHMWGYNSYGELGNNQTDASSVPQYTITNDNINKQDTLLYCVRDDVYVGSSVKNASRTSVVPSANGYVNSVSITALNSRTRASYASADDCTSTWYTRSCDAKGWSSICWSPELSMFCAVSSTYATSTGNGIMISTDGNNWQTISDIDSTWNSVCWSPELSLFCAVGTSELYYPPVNLGGSANPTTYNVTTGTYGNGSYTVSASSQGSTQFTCVNCYSTGATYEWRSQSGVYDTSGNYVGGEYTVFVAGEWSQIVLPSAIHLQSVTFTGSSTVVNFATYVYIFGGTDGINWDLMGEGAIGTSTTIDVSVYGASFYYNTYRFVIPTIIPSTNTFCRLWEIKLRGMDNIITSSDGTNWTVIPVNTGNNFRSICWSPELSLFCAVSDDTGGSTNVITSSDGITWSIVGINVAAYYSICWSPDLCLFCAVGLNALATSSDGIVWNQPVEIEEWYSICWSPELGIFCAVGVALYDYNIMISYDGTNWSGYYSSAALTFASICWSQELSIFCASVGTTKIAISKDGITWVTKTVTNTSSWLCWSPELSIFCAVAKAGTQRVMTSIIGMPNSRSTIKALPGQFMVDNAYNVGIGTTIYRQRLDVVGGNTIVSGNIGIGTTIPRFDTHVLGVSYFKTNVGIGTTIQRTTLDIVGDIIASGNIGIGTTLPAFRIKIPAGTATSTPLLMATASNIPQRYPPAALTTGIQNTTTTLSGQAYGNGLYTMSSSSMYGPDESTGHAFDLVTTWPGWTTTSAYDSSTGAYIGGSNTTVDGVAQAGEWIQLQLPNAIYPNYFVLSEIGTRNALSFVIAGSSNNTTWSQLYATSSSTATNTDRTITVNADSSRTAFTHYRYIARAINSDNLYGFHSLAEFAIYGIQVAKTLTVSAGAIEYDGNVFNMSTRASTRCVTTSDQLAILEDPYQIGSNVSLQKLFNLGLNGGSGNGTVTIQSGTYIFECNLALVGLDAKSSSFGFGFGGNATIGSMGWQAHATKSSTLDGNSITWSYNTGSVTSLVDTNTNTNCTCYIKGIIKVSTGGTLIPQVCTTAAHSAASVTQNTYFRIYKVSDIYDENIAIGNWS